VKSVPQNLCSTRTITRPNACDATTASQQSGVSQKLRAAGTPTANKADSLKHAANRGSSRRPATPVLMMPRQPKPPLRRSAPTLVRTRRPLPPPASAFRPAEGPIKVTNSKMQANRNSSSRRSRVGVEMTGPGEIKSDSRSGKIVSRFDHYSREKKDNTVETPDAFDSSIPSRARDERANLLIQKGDYWEISYQGRSSLLEDTRGLRYIALLAREAGKGPVHANELAALASGNTSAVVELTGKHPVMDSAAENRLIKRLEEIGFKRNTAMAQDNYERVSEIDEEIDRIAAELQRLRLPNGGRATFTTSAEKARKAVSKAITESIARMADDPGLEPLSKHFASTIQKGQWLSYNGNAEWHIDFHFSPQRSKTSATPKVAAARAANAR